MKKWSKERNYRVLPFQDPFHQQGCHLACDHALSPTNPDQCAVKGVSVEKIFFTFEIAGIVVAMKMFCLKTHDEFCQI